MAHSQDGIFLELPSPSGQAVLHPAKILESQRNRFTATPVSNGLAFQVGQRLTIYYHNRREFMKRMAVVESVDASDETTVVEFSHLGEACSADRRMEYRVSAVESDIAVGLEDEPACELADISMTGCSVLAIGPYELGQSLKIRLEHEGQTVVGEVIVRGIRSVGYDKTRYGLSVLPTRKPDDALKKMLRKMTMALERAQLQRLSRC